MGKPCVAVKRICPLSGETVSYISVAEAAKANYITRYQIHRVLDSPKKKCIGYKWERIKPK